MGEKGAHPEGRDPRAAEVPRRGHQRSSVRGRHPAGEGSMTTTAERPADADALAAIRRLDVFKGLTESEYARIAALAKLVTIPQDRVIPRGGSEDAPRAFLFLIKGQVAFAEFAMGAVPRGPVNPKKRAPPL